ncbi:MAG: TlpA family protein disulfide reductase [Bacteroidetes bacterium]|nr:TlpA family protein disulfide reductase [Bacteroidota bacterium]
MRNRLIDTKVLNTFICIISIMLLIVIGCKQAEQVPQTNSTTIEQIGLNIGETAPNFTMNNQFGKPVSLKDFRGKVVVIDFWATWCGPCVASIPKIKELNKKYSGDNFVLLGVSLDKDLEQWKSFISQEQMDWTHIADGQNWNNAVAVRYQIESIPNVWIIDKEGKIVGKELRGSAVESALTTIMGK